MFQGRFPDPSWQTCTLLACGWMLAAGRPPITTPLWVTGAATVRHGLRARDLCPLLFPVVEQPHGIGAMHLPGEAHLVI